MLEEQIVQERGITASDELMQQVEKKAAEMEKFPEDSVFREQKAHEIMQLLSQELADRAPMDLPMAISGMLASSPDLLRS